jgi:predicted phage tail protein
MLRRIRLYGALAKFVGTRVLYADVSSAADAVRFLVANFVGIEQHMSDSYYKVAVGTYTLAEDDLHAPVGSQDIQIVPVIGGAGAVGRIILGVVLIGLSFIPGIGALVAPVLFGLGASLVLGGVSQLLTPVPVLPKGQDRQDDPQKSYSFSGVQQTSRQGIPVPIVYGKRLTGSVVISAGVSTDVPAGDYAASYTYPGHIDTSTRFKYLVFYDWDTCLFGPNGVIENGNAIDGANGWLVDGRVLLRPISNTQAVVVWATGNMTSIYAPSTVVGIGTLYSAGVIVSNTVTRTASACGDTNWIRSELTNTFVAP